jgi:hypothetical protein
VSGDVQVGHPLVQGFCPMGCGSTLFLGSGGYVTCSRDKCPDSYAAADVLAVREHEHIVRLGEDTFSILHPLRERLEGELFECPLHAHVSGLDGPPRQPGRYRVRGSGGSFSWELLP